MKVQTEQRFTPLELETRPTVDTAAAAHYLHLAQNTLRIYACRGTGAIRPIRIPGSSKLHWKTDEIRKLLKVSQQGFASVAVMAFMGAAALVCLLIPDAFASLDWAGVAMLGAGVIGNRDYNDLSALVQAASKQDCIVHLHTGDDGKPVYSVGNSNIGAHEFASYAAAMAWVNGKVNK